MTATRPVGQLLREWREHRRLSQLDLAIQADISTRHLSFVETGRSKPTPEMILRLGEHLDVPLRERNTLLLAGGYAPAYPQHGLDEPELENVRSALKQVITAHLPYPALVVNRWWELVEANEAIGLFLDGCAPDLLEAPVNVLRLSLHPHGMSSRITNLPHWRAHLLTQLHKRADVMGDARLRELYAELAAYPGGLATAPRHTDVVLPLRFRHDAGELSFFSIASAVGTATDVTVEELAIEAFFPADERTAQVLHSL